MPQSRPRRVLPLHVPHPSPKFPKPSTNRRMSPSPSSASNSALHQPALLAARIDPCPRPLADPLIAYPFFVRMAHPTAAYPGTPPRAKGRPSFSLASCTFGHFVIPARSRGAQSQIGYYQCPCPCDFDASLCAPVHTCRQRIPRTPGVEAGASMSVQIDQEL
ncbi:hypothetical protein FIBSPDRAFT_466736 [Athelia psychrophila]|uniref:Uncharacterized protein n=1 Tax=Athelia psychrophila TaxID=1759441 RepID=A0A166LKY4_9AGAM|nr:hypothetical protein FIBSPDRAFT_466736 [Fibularhizoctonia sp. CBS 109695]